MRIIISPAKQMRHADDVLAPWGQPVFLERAQQLLDWLRTLSYEEAQRLWACSDKLARENYERLLLMDLRERTSPAVLAFDGIAFTYMAPSVFEAGQFAYVQEHLRILSGFYGVLKPMDGVVPYRLEMQAKARVAGCANLYEFWGNALYDEVMRGNGDRVIVNLASKEYSKAVERHLRPGDRFVTCTFAQEAANGKLVQKGVYCKMARGEMVRHLAVNDVRDMRQLESFDSPDWRFAPERSTDNELVFLRRA